MIFEPAFPQEDVLGEKKPGVNILMYMAAHAPKVVPKWFKATIMEPRPEVLPGSYLVFGSGSDHPQKELYVKYHDDEGFWHDHGEVPQSFKDEVEEYGVKFSESWDAARAWDKNKEEQRVFQWPIYWASKVIENHP